MARLAPDKDKSILTEVSAFLAAFAFALVFVALVVLVRQ